LFSQLVAIITYAKEVMISSPFVCLLAGLCKNYSTYILMAIFPDGPELTGTRMSAFFFLKTWWKGSTWATEEMKKSAQGDANTTHWLL